jgi:CDP-diacylglycerol--glycerol-3-phosphate 3-phosphatidyltransferase
MKITTIYDLKPAFQQLLRPLMVWLANAGITPNQITWAALLLSVATGAAVVWTGGASWLLISIPLVLLVRMALNALDGMLAKEYQQQSRAGAMLNEMGDVVADAALYLPLGLLVGVSGVMVTLFVIVGIFAEMAGVLGAAIGGTRRYDGPMGKSDRAFLFGCIALLLGLGMTPGWWVDVLLGIAVLLGGLTLVNRCRRGIAS